MLAVIILLVAGLVDAVSEKDFYRLLRAYTPGWEKLASGFMDAFLASQGKRILEG